MGNGKFVTKEARPFQVSISCQRPEKKNDMSAHLAGSLWIMFDFYNKLQTPGHQLARRGVTYDEIRTCNERMSWFELLYLSRDMGIIPELVTKPILEYVWKQCVTQDMQQQGQISSRSLSLDGFLEALARLALAAFPNKNPVQAIHELVMSLQLDDERTIRTRVKGKGRETQRKLYCRSQGERTQGAALALLNEKHATMRKEDMLDDEKQFIPKQQVRRRRSSCEIVSFASSNIPHSTPAWRQRLDQYNSGLKEKLRPYCYSTSQYQWEATEQFGLDLGLISFDRITSARVEIVNTSCCMLVIAGISQSCDALRASFNPKPFAAGLSRYIDLTFLRPDYQDDLEFGRCILRVELASCENIPGDNTLTTDEVKRISLSIPFYFRFSTLHIQPTPCSEHKRQEQRRRSSFSSLVARLPTAPHPNTNNGGYNSSSSDEE